MTIFRTPKLEQCRNFNKKNVATILQYNDMMISILLLWIKTLPLLRLGFLHPFKRTIISVDTCTCECKIDVCPAGKGSGIGISCSQNLSMTTNNILCHSANKIWKQSGRVVSAWDSQSSGPWFESCSGHLLDLFLVVPSWNLWPHL